VTYQQQAATRCAAPGRSSNRASAVDNTYIESVYNFILHFTGILYEAMPWVVIGAAFAGLVQELPTRRAPAVMLALGIAILTMTVGPWSFAVNAVVAVVIALTVAGLLLMIQPAVDVMLSFLAAHRNIAIVMSGFLGLVNPMCDCGVIVVMRRLLRKGLPLSCCVTYILSGPIMNVLVMATTYQAFYGRENLVDKSGQPLYEMGSFMMMGCRAAMGYLTAVVTGFVVERMYQRHGAKLLSPTIELPSGLPIIELDEYPPHAKPQSLLQRLFNISESTLHDFVDVMVPLIIGALIAASVRYPQIFTPFLPTSTSAWLNHWLDPKQIELVSNQNPAVAILIMIVVGFLITLCSETDAFVIANFSIRPAAKLAFLVFGPMLDLKLFFMYTRVFRPRLMWTIIGCIALQIFLYCLLTHYVWETYAPMLPGWPVPPAATGVAK
jgi:uncharacterized membrane protein YraQ (UPF0718 family)